MHGAKRKTRTLFFEALPYIKQQLNASQHFESIHRLYVKHGTEGGGKFVSVMVCGNRRMLRADTLTSVVEFGFEGTKFFLPCPVNEDIEAWIKKYQALYFGGVGSPKQKHDN